MISLYVIAFRFTCLFLIFYTGHGFNRLPGEDGRLPHYRFQCQNAASVLHGSVRHVAVKPINDAVLKSVCVSLFLCVF